VPVRKILIVLAAFACVLTLSTVSATGEAPSPAPSTAPAPAGSAPAAPTPSEPPTPSGPAVTDPATAPQAAAGVRVLRLGVSPAHRVTVVTANVAEYLNVRDNRHARDLRNFARRLNQVLLAKRDRGHGVYTPDLILLQEVNRTTAHRVRMLVSRALGYHYAIAGGSRSQPAPGRGAIVRKRTRHHALLTRSTAVLYNTATMRRPTSARKITFGYPKAQVYRWRQCPYTTAQCQADMWESRQSVIFRIVARATGRAYAVASIHFVPYRFLRPRLNRHQVPGFRQAGWLTAVRAAMNRHYPHARQIVGGDFNERLCADDVSHLGQPRCSTRRQFTALYRAALRHRNLHVAVGYGIDNIFTPGRILTSGKDATYKLAARRTTASGQPVTSAQPMYLTVRDFDRRFTTAGAFDRCNAAFARGAGDSRSARAISGCSERYYSDHPFDWAVIR
jgi:hypothetical protein